MVTYMIAFDKFLQASCSFIYRSFCGTLSRSVDLLRLVQTCSAAGH